MFVVCMNLHQIFDARNLHKFLVQDSWACIRGISGNISIRYYSNVTRTDWLLSHLIPHSTQLTAMCFDCINAVFSLNISKALANTILNTVINKLVHSSLQSTQTTTSYCLHNLPQKSSANTMRKKRELQFNEHHICLHRSSSANTMRKKRELQFNEHHICLHRSSMKQNNCTLCIMLGALAFILGYVTAPYKLSYYYYYNCTHTPF